DPEVSLDGLLGSQSAEDWRELADKSIACRVALAPLAGVDEEPQSPRRGEDSQVLLSTTCEGLLAVPGGGDQVDAMYEVLAPHPAHKEGGECFFLLLLLLLLLL
ncbi:unnamed protein product, partial [Prorocentrum cordatum]